MSAQHIAKARTTAVVLAGGTGQRVGLSIPKQLLKIAGKAVIEHTLSIFQQADSIDDVIVLMAPGYVPDVEKIVAKAGLTKVTKVIEGGSTRNETTERAIAALGEGLAEGEDRNVLFHDAVRPLLSQRVIKDCVDALDRYQAVDVAIPSADTIIVTRTHGGDGEFITDVPDRSRLRRGQTPQAFKLSTIRRAYEVAAGDPNFQATDDCSVVLKYLPDVPIYVVAGDEYNMKVTQPVDVFIADKLFQLASTAVPQPTDDAAYRELLTGKTLVVFGGSYGIGADIATLAESYGATVYALGRSTTGTHVENPEHIDEALTKAYADTGRVDYVINTAACAPHRQAGRDGQRDHPGSAERQLPGTRADRPRLVQVPRRDQGPAAALHLQQLHPRPRGVQPLLVDQGSHGEPHPGALGRVGGRRSAGELREPRAHRHPDAHQGVRRRARGHAAVLRGGRPDLARRPALGDDRPCHRRTPAGPDAGGLRGIRL